MATQRSHLTVLLAGTANLVIAAAKFVGGVLSGSSAMLSEAAHSLADTLNQVFLLTALRRSGRPPDARHPFGYGMERYFWSLLAAVAVFVLGAGFSVFQGVQALVVPERQRAPFVAFTVLGIALLLDGVSLARALWQVHRDAGPSNLWGQLRDAEPTVRAVVFEDSAAVLGVLLAAGGLTLDHLFSTTVFDAYASIAIGVLLVGIAVTLGRQNQDLLIGRAIPEDLLESIRREIESSAGIDHVVQMMTMRLGPEEVLLAVRVAVPPGSSGQELAEAADDIDCRVQTRFPEVRHVFLDPTST